jgi:hypothetical protein
MRRDRLYFSSMKDQLQDNRPAQPPSFFALGYDGLPTEFEAENQQYRRTKIFKHDFFASTGLYADATGRLVVLKLQRTYPFFGIPMRWLGARIARHEIAIFRQLQGIRGIPKFIGVFGATGYVHEFIPGEDLSPDLHPDEAFFSDLARLFSDLHSNHVAYVDTNKRENILFGSDGRPYLIDFQISFWLKRGAHDHFLARWIFKRLVHEDWYHYYKHKTRLAPQCCNADDFARANNRSWYIRVHRTIFRPLIQLRRKFLAQFKKSPTELR